MSQNEKFDALNRVLVAFIESTDAMKKAAVDMSPEAALMTGQWLKCPKLEEKMVEYKTRSDALSGSCTRLSLVDLANMPVDALQSLFDEILQISHGLISTVMALFGMKLSRPLFDEVHRLAKAELTQVHGVVSIHTGRFESCMAAIGQVWEMNEAIQKLPLTNKVAYKRALMGVLCVVKDTHREFKEARDESAELNKNKSLGEDEDEDEDEGVDKNMDDGWGVMMDDEEDGGFSPEEMPYVNAALSLMEKTFTFIKVTMDVMALLSEHPPSSTVFTMESTAHLDVEVWVATVFNIDKQFSTLVTNLGMELYAPLSLNSLQVQYDITYAGIAEVQQQLLEVYETCQKHNFFNEQSDTKMKNLLGGTKELLTQIDLERVCFISLWYHYRMNKTQQLIEKKVLASCIGLAMRDGGRWLANNNAEQRAALIYGYI